MERYGIVMKKAFGISTPVLRSIAKNIGSNHDLSLRLWPTEILGARAIAAPHKMSEEQMEEWVKEFDNWATCDTCCGRVFDKTSYCRKKIRDWSCRKEEYIKRAAFSLMAAISSP